VKITEGLKLIKEGWIRKPKGFRVRFDKRADAGIETVYSPSLDDAPLKSDVTAWRYAWKLRQATRAESEVDRSGALYNIVVVDDQDQPVNFYVTCKKRVYNPRLVEGGSESPRNSTDKTTAGCMDINES
jgi:hypothetical protein